MGLDDRDYMRERYRQRQGLDPGKTQWNDRAARVEMAHQKHKKAVPLGGGGGGDGGWFARKNRNFDYRTGRYRPAAVLRPHPAQKWIFLLPAVSFLFPAYRAIKRAGWLPDWEQAIPFPSSGRSPGIAGARSCPTSVSGEEGDWEGEPASWQAPSPSPEPSE